MKKLCLGIVVLAAAGCDATDTGNPVNDGPSATDQEEPPEDCLERPRDLLPEEPTPLGVSAAAVAAMVRGEHRQTLGWYPIQIEDGPNVIHGPESGIGELVLAVEPTGTHRYIERDPRPYDSSDGQQNLSVCEDQIELDVELEATSSGGGLSETFTTTLRASSADVAYGTITFGADSLGGTLTARVEGEGWVTTAPAQLRLDFSLSGYGSAGYLEASQPIAWADLPDRRQTWAESLARFPPQGACGPDFSLVVPNTGAIRSLSVASALGYANAASPERLSGTSSTITYSIESTAETSCVNLTSFRPSAVTLEGPARVRLSAPDAGLEGSVDVRLWATSVAGALEAVQATASAESRDASALAELGRAFAITTPIDFSGFDGGRFELDLTVTPVSSGGSVRVTGLIYPACAGGSAPPLPDDGRVRPCSDGPASRDVIWSTRWERD